MDIETIKHHLPIKKVLSHYQLKPDRNNMLRCPFHDDKKPSLQIYPETDTWCCFSTNCEADTGDGIEFIQLIEGCNKHEAILKAQELAGLSTAKAGQAENGQIKQSSKKPSSQKSKSKSNGTMERPQKIAVFTKVFSYFKNAVSQSGPAKEYLQKRALDYKKLEVGYNSGQFHHKKHLPEGKKGELFLESCRKVGLLWNNPSGGHYVWGNRCIIFPLRDKEGNIVSLYGRRIKTSRDRRHHYPKDREGLYPGYPPKETRKLILTEGETDAATLLQLPEITEEYEILALFGTNGLNAEHRDALSRLEHLEEVIFMLDGDGAGKQAVQKHSPDIHELLPQVNISNAEPPNGEDVNSLLQSHEPEIFQHLLKDRDFLFSIEKENLPAGRHGQNGLLKGKLNTKNPEYITYRYENLKMALLGGISINQLDRMRVTLKISLYPQESPLHNIRHNLDLYNNDQVRRYTRKAAEKLEVGTTTLNRAVVELIEKLEQYRMSKIEARKDKRPKKRKLTPERTKRARAYLQKKDLMKRTQRDLGRVGIIGEEKNRLVMWLVFISRLREQPLHVITLGSSGTGKTYLVEKVAELIPDQHKLEITILSENAFYYFDRTELKNKLVIIEDMDGAEEVLYPLRELQTKRKISKTIPMKDAKGNIKTITLHVEGPISLAGTTTRERLYEDNANRCLLLYLDNSKEQQQKIMDFQRKLSAGKVNTKKITELKERFKDIQTILKPIQVRNPYAEQLKIPERCFKPLRTHDHYLKFIETVTFYHQYQREVKKDEETGEKYIETSLEDIEWANYLLKDILLAKSDELSGGCREFFERLKKWLRQENKTSFYSKEVRKQFRISPRTVNYYFFQLNEYGLLKKVGGSRYKKGYRYELTTWKDYAQLKEEVNTILDELVEKIKQRCDSSAMTTPNGE
jgi:DNA primase catalytic core